MRPCVLMNTINVAETVADLYDLIEMALDEPIRITSKRGTVVMISEEELESILETIYLIGVPGLVDDIEESRRMPTANMIRWKSGGT